MRNTVIPCVAHSGLGVSQRIKNNLHRPLFHNHFPSPNRLNTIFTPKPQVSQWLAVSLMQQTPLLAVATPASSLRLARDTPKMLMRQVAVRALFHNILRDFTWSVGWQRIATTLRCIKNYPNNTLGDTRGV